MRICRFQIDKPYMVMENLSISNRQTLYGNGDFVDFKSTNRQTLFGNGDFVDLKSTYHIFLRVWEILSIWNRHTIYFYAFGRFCRFEIDKSYIFTRFGDFVDFKSTNFIFVDLV